MTWTGAAEWPAWKDLKLLSLDRECLVGTSRNFKDAEGHRLPQEPEKQDDTYVEFKEDNYRTMIDAGINLFNLKPRQEAWVGDEPVFYIRHPMAKPVFDFPADFRLPTRCPHQTDPRGLNSTTGLETRVSR